MQHVLILRCTYLCQSRLGLVSRARRIYYVFITLGGARAEGKNTSGVSRVLSVNDYGVMLCNNYVKLHSMHVTKTLQ